MKRYLLFVAVLIIPTLIFIIFFVQSKNVTIDEYQETTKTQKISNNNLKMILNETLLNITTANNNNNNVAIHHTKDFYIGLSLALLSSFFIGSSFILKKKGLLKLCSTSNSVRAAQGGYGYLKEWLWWGGLLTMGVGELCNFAAYGFAPATLVTPLGACSVLISAIMSSYFLNEHLNTIGKIGCLLTAIGSTIMVIHAPKEGEVNSLNELLIKLKDTGFILFTLICLLLLIFLIVYMVPRYGNTNILIFILICSILGSFTVMSCKGLSLGIKELISSPSNNNSQDDDINITNRNSSYLFTYLFGFIVLICIIVQMNYLNRSLDIFNTAIVTTVYYVLFTLCVMIASAILFKELANIKFVDFIGCLCGFSTIVCALCLIHFFKVDNMQDVSLLQTLNNAPKFVSNDTNNYLSNKLSQSQTNYTLLQVNNDDDSNDSSDDYVKLAIQNNNNNTNNNDDSTSVYYKKPNDNDPSSLITLRSIVN